MFFRFSLRARIAAWSAVFSLLASATAAAIMAYAPYREATAAQDAEAASRVESALTRVIADPSPLEAPSDVFADMPGFVGFASGPEKKQPVVLPGKLRASLPAWPPSPGFYDAVRGAIPDTRFAVARRAGAAVLVAYDVSDTNTALRNRLGFLHLAPIFGLLGGLGGWFLAGRALRPVSRLAEAAERITAGNLAERLPEPVSQDEIARLTEVLNRMLARLETTFAQSARFSADASHELRTPLTIMRGTIEEALRSGAWSEKQEKTLLGLLDEVTMLTAITETLLMLARFDAGVQTLKRVPVDISALLAELVDDAAMLAEPRSITIGSELEPGVILQADRHLLRRLFMNLLDNAVRHNREGGSVDVKLSWNEDGTQARLVMRNTGPAISREDASRLFTRFFRTADDRGRETGGSGLGLSLCHEIARAHGGSIRLESSDADGTTFAVLLPVTAG